jgi:hypothetical protein
VSERPTADALLDALRPLVAELVEQELDRRLAAAEQTEWLTVEEYAERRRTTPGAVHKRLERGQVEGAVREGKRWLIPAQAKVAPLENEGRAPRERPRPGNRRY